MAKSMAIAQFPLYLDTVSGRLAISSTNSQGARLRDCGSQDKLLVQLQNLLPTGLLTMPGSRPFSIIPPTGSAATVAIVNASSTILASVTLAEDAPTSKLIGILDLETSEMVTELGASSSISARLSVKIIDGTSQAEFFYPITIFAAAQPSGSPVPVPGQTYYTADEARQLFLLKGGDSGFILTDTVTGQRMIFTCENGLPKFTALPA